MNSCKQLLLRVALRALQHVAVHRAVTVNQWQSSLSRYGSGAPTLIVEGQVGLGPCLHAILSNAAIWLWVRGIRHCFMGKGTEKGVGAPMLVYVG